ncbi:MAG: hypothetical protein EXR72_08005 [Myxococcales bacterium]|nr:hypothetical protein [Myxococcales bacterium]
MQRPRPRSLLLPARALLHPLWIASLAVLVVNDHFLKGAGLAPGWLTGKLSDLAGYLLFPMLLAALLRVRTRRGAAFAHLASVALLLALELSPALCALLHRTLGVRLWADPTDLVALASIALSWRLLVPVAEAPIGVPRLLARSLGAVGALASIATSQNPPPDTSPPTPRPQPQTSQMFLWNQTTKDLQVRVSAPRPGVTFDCQDALRWPERALPADLFHVVRHVTVVRSGRIALDSFATQKECNALLLSAEAASDTVITWRADSLPSLDIASGFVANDQGVRLQDQKGIRVFAVPDNVISGESRPDLPPATGIDACAPPLPGSEPDWSEPLPSVGPWKITGLVAGADGCDEVALANQGGQPGPRFFACSTLPGGLPFKVGELLSFKRPQSGATGAILESAATTVALVRRATTGTFVDGACEAQRRSCGVARAARVRLATPAGQTNPLAAGDLQTLGAGGLSVFVHAARVERTIVADVNCDAASTLGNVASYVWVQTKEMK